MLVLVKSFNFFLLPKNSALVILARKIHCVMELFLVFGRLPIAGREDWAIKSFSRTAVHHCTVSLDNKDASVRVVLIPPQLPCMQGNCGVIRTTHATYKGKSIKRAPRDTTKLLVNFYLPKIQI